MKTLIDVEQQLGKEVAGGEGNIPTERRQERGLSLPRIGEFPNKVRPAIQEAFLKVEASSQIAYATALNVSRICIIQDHKIPYETDQTKKLIESPSDKSKSLADEQLAKVATEIKILQAAYKKIAKGDDAPELRKTSTPFADKFVTTVQFEPAEIKKFGSESRNPLHRIRNAVRSLGSSTEDKKKFQGKVQELFRDRTFALLSGALRESPLKYNHFADGAIREFNERITPSTTEVVEPDDINQAFNRYFEGFKDKAVRLAANQVYLQALEKLLESNFTQLNTIDFYGRVNSDSHDRLGDTLKYNLGLAKHSQDEHAKRFIYNLDNGPTQEADQLVNLLLNKIYTQVKIINSSSRPIQVAWQLEYPYADLSQDCVDLSLQLKAALEPLEERLGKIHSFDESIGLLRFEEQKAQQQREQNETLPQSQDLMFHIAPWEYMQQILERGFLSSRKAQIEKFGSSNFSSGRIKVGKDFVEMPDMYGYKKRMTKAEFDEFQKTQSNTFTKQSWQEEHQVCFIKEGPYVGRIPQVGLAFSKAKLLSESQFMVDDGWHLFDKNHSSDNLENSPGLSLDLQEEPVMIVVNSNMREEFTDFVKNNMAQSDRWREPLADAEAWIENNVVFIDQEPHPIIPEGQFYSQDTNKVVKDKFFKKHQVEVKQGRFVPSGNTGDNPTRQLIPLWEYQKAA